MLVMRKNTKKFHFRITRGYEKAMKKRSLAAIAVMGRGCV